MATAQPAVTRHLARPGRRVLVAPRLEMLRGPAAGRVELPVWLFWSGRDRCFDLGDADERAWLYEIVLREAGHPDDLMTFLNAGVLVSLWPQIRKRLPEGVRLGWEDKHPCLLAAGRRPAPPDRVPVSPLARQVAHIILPAASRYGFAVAGGTALIEHGIVDRLTEDLDVFSPREDAVEAAAAGVEAALRAAGLHAERRDKLAGLASEFPEWDLEDLGTGLGEWLITAPGGEQIVLQMSCFPRSRAPVIIDAIPVLHAEDAVGLKCHAFCTRVEPRDALDMAMALGRWSPADLIGFARRVQPSLRPGEFAEAGQNLDATPDERFTRIGLTARDITLVRERLSTWPRDPAQVPPAP